MDDFFLKCPVCGNKLGETMLGKKFCPRCVGREMARKCAKKLKLELPND